MIRLLPLVLLAGCSSLGTGQQLGATLTAVNYTDWPFDWVGVARVAEPDKAMAADRATAFGASGQMCCVSLPAKWQPGMVLVVQTQDGTHAKSSEEWDKEHIPIIQYRVAVPRYESDDVGTVWVQLLPGGQGGAGGEPLCADARAVARQGERVASADGGVSAEDLGSGSRGIHETSEAIRRGRKTE
ncbi:protein of unknown function [Pseudogulbenkiania sp. NH8B]|uniref:DUF3304 domain-containing protein n=1 Tax=Pseudogulbenkiania sp. (strain NH8B) TaxID=748280 RepID=UPI0002279C82|nr:DUF3304 domain-containing protein [Pseudogulbenkiania sp. NH8B]BAK75955.1 protein of unknown function [Pseudogulbenkiania sp. NH8B]